METVRWQHIKTIYFQRVGCVWVYLRLACAIFGEVEGMEKRGQIAL